MKKKYRENLIGTYTLAFSEYGFSISSDKNEYHAYRTWYKLLHNEIKADYQVFYSNEHTVNMGLNAVKYTLLPGNRDRIDDMSLVLPIRLEKERAIEASVYLSDEFQVNNRLSIYGGFRLTQYAMLGPRSVNIYMPGKTKNVIFIIDTTVYKKTRRWQCTLAQR
ncbi:MAG: hypothetical protein HC896_17005 [Bacteroidales bacterium]|nr:hypothetical protein [Bacteroidales bacterium]